MFNITFLKCYHYDDNVDDDDDDEEENRIFHDF